MDGLRVSRAYVSGDIALMTANRPGSKSGLVLEIDQRGVTCPRSLEF